MTHKLVGVRIAAIVLCRASLSVMFTFGAQTGALQAAPSNLDNFRICAAADDEDFKTPQIVIPPGIIFLSWGPLVGDLTDPGHDTAYDTQQDKDHYAVITTKDVILTKSQKCATTTVLVALSPEDAWNHKVVKKADNLVFQALEPEHYVFDLNSLPNHLGDYLAMGILNGTPTADITDTHTISAP